ncbi:MAG: ureidoglycolate lyase [Planctomycetes bacterium]|nr:ureidoglycolate lyase [Planctomycetota bacterium]
MRSAPVRELTPEAFAPYGTFADMINPDTTKIGDEPIEFFRDMLQLDLGSKSIASFSTCRVLPRPAVVDITEYHSSCGEAALPLDADVLIHVAVATVNGEAPVDKVEIFRVPAGTMIAIRPGVWHHAPFAQNADVANVLIVLPERTYANDCTVYEIPFDDRTRIQGV